MTAQKKQPQTINTLDACRMPEKHSQPAHSICLQHSTATPTHSVTKTLHKHIYMLFYKYIIYTVSQKRPPGTQHWLAITNIRTPWIQNIEDVTKHPPSIDIFNTKQQQ